jgi:hypothetical protein
MVSVFVRHRMMSNRHRSFQEKGRADYGEDLRQLIHKTVLNRIMDQFGVILHIHLL